MDVYWWSGQNKKAVAIGKKGLSNQISDPKLSYKVAQAYKRINNSKEAIKIIDSLLTVDSGNKEYLNFKKSIYK